MYVGKHFLLNEIMQLLISFTCEQPVRIGIFKEVS